MRAGLCIISSLPTVYVTVSLEPEVKVMKE